MPTLRSLAREFAGKCSQDGVTVRAAALAYCGMFSLPPFLLLLIALGGSLLGGSAPLEAEVFRQIDTMIGGDGGTLLKSAIGAMPSREGHFWAYLSGVALLCVSATALLRGLCSSLDSILGTPRRIRDSWMRTFRHAVLSLLLLVCAVVSLVFSIAVTALLGLLHLRLAAWTGFSLPALSLFNDVLSFCLVTGFVFLLYRALPSRTPPWEACLVAALGVTLFTAVGRWAFSLYVAAAHVGAVYGVAASALVLLLWLYYAILIFLLGAELIELLARHSFRH